jgi:hypothetical protein
MTEFRNPTTTALVVLAVLQTVMLAAMFSQVQPHPPLTIPLFAVGPFLGASIAVTLAALAAAPEGTVTGRVLSGIAMLTAMISFGPQKWFDPMFAQIWPAVVSAQLAAIVIIARLVLASRARSAT